MVNKALNYMALFVSGYAVGTSFAYQQWLLLGLSLACLVINIYGYKVIRENV